jgi:hypothetical protein
MTQWTTESDVAQADDVPVIRRRPGRSALRRATSRRALHGDARDQARLVRGREAFIWRGRILPIGVPLATAAGLLSWRERRSTRDTLVTVLGVAAASYLEARVEWGLRRRAYMRRKDAE